MPGNMVGTPTQGNLNHQLRKGAVAPTELYALNHQLSSDGHTALQDELTETEKGTNVVFLHTAMEDGDHFQQILAWTLKSR